MGKEVKFKVAEILECPKVMLNDKVMVILVRGRV